MSLFMSLPQHYAQALFDLTKHASGDECERIRANVLATLKRRGHEKLLPRIVAEYERRMHSHDSAKPTIMVAHESDVQLNSDAINRAAAALGTDRAALAVAIDPTIVGGFSIRTESAQFDATHKRALISLYHHLTT
jgi:F0F1-type ATP synthase delta subunit